MPGILRDGDIVRATGNCGRTRLDGFAKVSEYAERQKEINQKYLCITDHGVMGAVPQQIAESEKHKLFPLFGCLPKGSPIHALDGVKPIEDIKVGDFVLTHLGRFRKVISTMRRRHTGKVCRIVLADSPKNSKGYLMTDEHPVFIRSENGTTKFIRADEIVAGRRTTAKGVDNWRSYVAFPKGGEGNRQTINLNDYLPVNIGSGGGSFIKKLAPTVKSETLLEWPSVPSTMEVGVEFAALLGFFVVEGHVRYGENTNGTISFCFNIDEVDTYALEVSELLSELFGLKPTIYRRPERGSCEVIVGCVPVAHILASLCGVGSHNKRIPEVIFASDEAVRISFMDALLRGDGKNPRSDANSARTLKVASPALAHGFKRLLATFGEWSSVGIVAEEDKVAYSVPYYPSRTYARFLSDHENVYKPIREVVHEIADLEVYNFEVEEDNSYVSSFSLHNCELYVNFMQPQMPNRAASAEYRKSLGDGSGEATKEQKRFDKSNHLLAIAYNNVGYSNLVRLTSWAWIHGYYRRPRVNHEVLQKYKEGIIFTSTCGNSEIAYALFNEGEEAAFAMVEKYMAMFGEHFYLELMMLDWKQQKPYDIFLLKAHAKYHIPLILTQDCHYCKKEHSHNQRLMLMQQNKRTLAEVQSLIESGEGEDLFELQDTNLWLKSEDELNEKWEADYKDVIDYDLFKQSKANTVAICQLAKGVQIDRELKFPKIPNAEEVLWEEIQKGFKARACPNTDQYNKRIQEEYELIVEKGFSSYFLIQKEMTDEARQIGPEILGFGDGSECVGPGRGSVCGSLVAYCLRLHDVEPIIHDLRFSRFLSPARGGKQMKIRHSINPIPHQEIEL